MFFFTLSCMGYLPKGILLVRQAGDQACVLLYVERQIILRTLKVQIEKQVGKKGFTALDRPSATERLDSLPGRRSSWRSSSCRAASRASRTPTAGCSSRCQRSVDENHRKCGHYPDIMIGHLKGVYASISPSLVNSLRR